jgi:hypothetical protein
MAEKSLGSFPTGVPFSVEGAMEYVSLDSLAPDTAIAFQGSELTIDNSRRGGTTFDHGVKTAGDIFARWERVKKDWEGHSIVWTARYTVPGLVPIHSATFRTPGRPYKESGPMKNRIVRMDGDLWDWCQNQPGGAAEYLRGLASAHRKSLEEK